MQNKEKNILLILLLYHHLNYLWQFVKILSLLYFPTQLKKTGLLLIGSVKSLLYH